MWLLFIGSLVTTGVLLLVSEFDDKDNAMIDFLGIVVFSTHIGLFIAFLASPMRIIDSFFRLLETSDRKNKLEQKI